MNLNTLQLPALLFTAFMLCSCNDRSTTSTPEAVKQQEHTEVVESPPFPNDTLEYPPIPANPGE